MIQDFTPVIELFSRPVVFKIRSAATKDTDYGYTTPGDWTSYNAQAAVFPADSMRGGEGLEFTREGLYETDLIVFFVKDPLTDDNGTSLTIEVVRDDGTPGTIITVDGADWMVVKDWVNFSYLGKFRGYVAERVIERAE
jgi:hypothetical protein